MNSFSRRMPLLALAGLAFAALLAPLQAQNILFHEAFSDGISQDWWGVSTDGAVSWKSSNSDNTRGIQANQLYIHNPRNGHEDLAILSTQAIDLSRSRGDIFLTFDLNTQLFKGNGTFFLEIWNGRSWEGVFSEDHSYNGNVSLEIGAFRGSDMKVKFAYESKGQREEFVSIDNFSIISRPESATSSLARGTSLMDSSYLFKADTHFYTLVVNAKESLPLNYEIWNVAGELVFQDTETLRLGENQISIDSSSFPKGLYFITLKKNREKLILRMMNL